MDYQEMQATLSTRHRTRKKYTKN